MQSSAPCSPHFQKARNRREGRCDDAADAQRSPMAGTHQSRSTVPSLTRMQPNHSARKRGPDPRFALHVDAVAVQQMKVARESTRDQRFNPQRLGSGFDIRHDTRVERKLRPLGEVEQDSCHRSSVPFRCSAHPLWPASPHRPARAARCRVGLRLAGHGPRTACATRGDGPAPAGLPIQAAGPRSSAAAVAAKIVSTPGRR